MRTLDISVAERSPRTAAEWLWPLVPLGVSVFCMSALVAYHVRYEVVEARSLLQVVIAGIYQTVGLAPAMMFFLMAATWSSIWFVTGRLERPLRRLGHLLAMAVMLAVFLNIGDATGGVRKGVLGAWLASVLVASIGYFPSVVLVWIVTFASLLLATDFFFSDSFERLRRRPADEAGVENAVTDHLRGLAIAVPAEPPRTAQAAPPPEPAPVELGFLHELEAAREAAADEEVELPRRRRSYFERRAELDVATAAQWAPAELDDAAERAGAALGAEGGVRAGAEAIEGTSIEADAIEAEVDAVEAELAPEPVAESAARPAERFDDWIDLTAAVAADEPDEAAFAGDATEPRRTASEQVAAEPAPVRDVEVGFHAAGDRDEDELAIRSGILDTAPAEELEETPPIEAIPGIEATELDAATIEFAETAETAATDATDPTGEIDGTDEPDDDGDETTAFADLDEAAATVDAGEALVPIPRPEAPPRAPARQQQLFASAVDEGLVDEAVELVAGQSRVSAALLQRRLRIDYAQAIEVLAQLGARGLVQLEADATQGRVIV